MNITVKLIRPAAFGFEERLADLKPMLEAWLAYHRAIIASEFEREGWQSPGGGFIPWPKTEAFGTIPAPPKTMSRTGTLAAAWQGGSGGFERIGESAVEFGVRFPHANVHRPPGANAAAARQPFKIAVTERMRAFFHAVGAHLRNETKEISIPRRPHATSSPELRTGLYQIARRHLAGQPIGEVRAVA